MRRARLARDNAEIRRIAPWLWMLVTLSTTTGCAAAESAPAEEGSASASGEEGGGGLHGTGGNGGAAGHATAAGGSPASCVYPPGPYGVHQGEVVDALAEWQGFPAGAGAPEVITAGDYLDCDGSRGIHALLVLQSATWCAPCQIEAAVLEEKMAGGWSALGVAVLTLMVEEQPDQPATVATAQAWKNEFDLTSVTVAADPQFSFDGFDFDLHIPHSGFPTQLLVDPRTMTIVVRQDGDAPLDAQVEQLASDNQ